MRHLAALLGVILILHCNTTKESSKVHRIDREELRVSEWEERKESEKFVLIHHEPKVGDYSIIKYSDNLGITRGIYDITQVKQVFENEIVISSSQKNNFELDDLMYILHTDRIGQVKKAYYVDKVTQKRKMVKPTAEPLLWFIDDQHRGEKTLSQLAKRIYLNNTITVVAGTFDVQVYATCRINNNGNENCNIAFINPHVHFSLIKLIAVVIYTEDRYEEAIRWELVEQGNKLED